MHNLKTPFRIKGSVAPGDASIGVSLLVVISQTSFHVQVRSMFVSIARAFVNCSFIPIGGSTSGNYLGTRYVSFFSLYILSNATFYFPKWSIIGF